ncbi:MAG: hypothetical protein LBJ96_04855 [Holosporaceae bacterium]|jgi:hypothetical protein|nr:hypothetical protein [Holosporaceae bacterium]
MISYASRFSKINTDEICRNLQRAGYPADPKKRVRYIKEALMRKDDKSVNNAMKALDYYKKFEDYISEIEKDSRNFSEIEDPEERAVPHYNAWCEIFGKVVGGAPLRRSVEEVRDTQWTPSVMPGSDFEESKLILSKNNKPVFDEKTRLPKREIVHEVYGNDDILHENAPRKVKVIWPPYEYVTGWLHSSPNKTVRKKR